MKSVLVNQLLLEEDLHSKFELVEIFQNENNKAAHRELRSLLIDYTVETDTAQRISNFDPVRLYGPGRGLSRYVSNQLLLAVNVKLREHKAKVLNDLKIVLNNLSESKNPLLKVTKAKSLLDHLERFLGNHFYKITYERFLNIYFIPFENRLSNAAFDINTNSIAVFKTKERDTQTPEYIFIHEFGHILHSTIFKTSKNVPESFVEFNKKMNPKFFEYSKEDQLEIYADLFSVAVMLDSEFKDYNPFIRNMQNVHLRKIKDYFVNEISNLK
jgi:hypothetical protein